LFCAEFAVSGLAPEIAHFRIPNDGMDDSMAPADWYIKGARYVDSLIALNSTLTFLVDY
jgi:hypothetical protein